MTRHRRTTPAAASALAGAALAAALTLTACGQGTATAPPSTAPSASPSTAPSASSAHDEADVAFLQQVVARDRSVLGMTALASTRASSQQVGDLAARTAAELSPQVDRVSALLRSWGEPVATAAASGTPSATAHTMVPLGAGAGTSAGTGAAPGAPTPAQLDQLEEATGTAFDRTFLQLVIAQHLGAVSAADTELDAGRDPGARQLARSVATVRTDEVAQLRRALQLLDT